MATRRDVLAGAVAAGALMHTRFGFAKAAQPATNWPHPDSAGGSTNRVSPLHQVDNGLVLNQLPLWAPDAAIRKKILVDNPARLYAFG